MTILPIKLRRVIITGPTGAVGMALVQDMMANNIEVVAVCRPNSKRLDSVPIDRLVKVVECDLSDLLTLPEKINGKFDAFFHLGWDGTHGEGRDDLYKQNLNVKNSLDAVSVAKKIGCKVFVGVGSQAEYGPVEGIINEKTVCNPISGYAIAKYSAYLMTKKLCSQLDVRFAWCRIVSLFGPGDGDYTMIMSTLKKMLNNQRTSFTKAEQDWDYIYSKDAARAFRLIAERGKDGEIYCICSGITRKLKDFIKSIRDIVDPNLEVGIGELDYYPDQVMNLKFDTTNLNRDTGFVPSVSFEEGIKETIQWLKKR